MKNTKKKNIKYIFSRKNGLSTVFIIFVILIIILVSFSLFVALKSRNQEKKIIESNRKSLEGQESTISNFSSFAEDIKKQEKISENEDSDNDRIADYMELDIYHTDPNNSDSDDDGLSDWHEIVIYSTDPLDGDTDSDGMSDGEEIKNGSNPNGTGSMPGRGGVSPGFISN